jgi:translocator protein
MKPRQIINIVALIVMVGINILANALPIAGRDTGEISDMYPVLFTPAGYVFSIWLIIYVGLTAFVIYQAQASQRDNPRFERVGYWFVANALLNALWIFLWHNLLITLSMLVMLGILATLIVIYQRLEIGRTRVSTGEKWLARVPFSIYFGWISVATIANAAIMLYNLGWRGEPLTQEIWTVLVIAVATAIGAFMIFSRREVAFPLVLVWAFIGIYVRQSDVNLVPIVAMAAAVLIALLIIIDRLRRRGMV